MKIPKKSKDKKQKTKNKQIVKPKKEQILIVAQEIKFARLLSGNEKKTRDRVLKTLKKWLSNCFQKQYEFKEEDFMRVWKGLFYAVWMSDKPLVQEELCETIASILDLFPEDKIKDALLMVKAGFKTLAKEWYGIDQHRIDKFLMLSRRYLRGSLRCVKSSDWSPAACKRYSDMLASSDGLFAVNTPHYARNASSLLLHVTDCYLEEISKVSEGKIPPESLAELLRPFTTYLAGGASLPVCVAARRLLTALMRQSDEGLRYQEATEAWKQMGCPAGGPEALELVSDDETAPGDDEDEETDESPSPLDPRAGRVDVRLRPLAVPAAALAQQLRGLLPKAGGKAHKRLKICLDRFEVLSQGQYPLPAPPPAEEAGRAETTPPDVAARTLKDFETKLRDDTDELKLRGLSRKHRKRLLRKSRAGLSIVDDAKKAAGAAAGEWQVESTESESKSETNDTDKENVSKKKHKNKSNKRKHEVEAKQDSKKQKVDELSKPTKVDKNKVKTEANTAKNVNKVKEKPTNAKKDSDKTVNKVANGNVKEPSGTPKDKTYGDPMKKAKVDKNAVLKQKQTDKQTKAKPTLVVNKVKNFQKPLQVKEKSESPKKKILETPKKVQFVLKNNSMQKPVDYYKSVRKSPSIPFDSSKRPNKTNLKPSTPSPINPFFKKKMKFKNL